MTSVKALFDAFGGPAAVGCAIGKRTEHASTMRYRGSIPVRYWPALIKEAQRRGIPLDEATLVEIHTQRTVEHKQAAE